jgi:predicted nucleic acid-binding protein
VKIFFDTSVLIASFWKEHPGHAQSLAVFYPAKSQSACCGLHSLAEFYASITAMPVRNRFDPQQTSLYIEEIRKRCTPVSLSEDEYVETLELVASKGLTSGVVYDALLLRCAEKVDAGIFYTWNVKHFRSIRPELSDQIRTP